MKMLTVGTVDRLAVLQPLEHDERGVQKRHGEQDQGQHERHHGGRLDGRLDRDHAHQQAEQVGAAVAHEARSRREVEDEEAERDAGRDRGEHARLLAAEVEGDHRHRGGDDHAHACGQAVDAVGEVDDVHHRHEADHGQHGTRVGDARVGERQRADERQRYRLHGDAVVHHDHGRHDLAGELDHRRHVEAVVERADERDHAGRQQHAVPELVVLPEPGRQPDQARGERAGEDRKPAEQRRRAVGEPALARLVDRPGGDGEAHRERRQERRHGGGKQEGV